MLSCVVLGQKVLGVDINTTGKKFAIALAKKGYKPTESVNGCTTYNVTFAGYKNTQLYVYLDEANDSITDLSFKFGNRTKAEKSDIFYNLEKQYKEKYPQGKSERFDYDIINSHSRRWYINNAGVIISLNFDEVSGKLYISYRAKHNKANKTVKPSDDI